MTERHGFSLTTLSPPGQIEHALDDMAPGGMADVAPGGMADVAPEGIADGAPIGIADGAPIGIADVAPGVMADGAPGVMADGAPVGLADVAPEGMADGAPIGMDDVSPVVMADVAPEGMADVAPGVMADVAPGVMADVAPVRMADVAPGVMADVAPEGMADGAPIGMADGAPEGMADVAPEGMADVDVVEPLVEVERQCALIDLEDGTPALAIKYTHGVVLTTIKWFSNFTQDWISRIEMTGPNDGMVYNVMEYQYRGESRSEVLMIQAGWNDDQRRPYLYECGPSDDFLASYAAAENYGRRKHLLETWCDGCIFDLQENAICIALLNLESNLRGEMTKDNIEIGIFDENGFHQLTPAEVKDYINMLPLLKKIIFSILYS
ncbi:hypothetical protein ACJMK2_021303 [Sinanodonta woodiana]|uniref:Uncharacterized protein n=1 Tax=Sinanodonta woodiana TaxID=1069815 RepID=A0ABD3TGW9_SINWO